MKISIIITVYNRLHMLSQCLLALQQQTLMAHEIIISDDGSEEDIVAYFKQIKPGYPLNLKLVKQQHEGFRASRIRNNAVSVATGDLLVFLDQDIIVPPCYLKVIADNKRADNFLSSYPVRLNEAQSKALSDEMIAKYTWSSLITTTQGREIRRKYRKELFENLLIRYTGLGSHGAKLRGGVSAISYADYVAVNGYDESFNFWGGEDDDLGRRLLAYKKVGKNIAYHHYPLHLYHTPFHQNNPKHNDSYITKRKKEIGKSNFRCEMGLDAPRDDIEVYCE